MKLLYRGHEKKNWLSGVTVVIKVRSSPSTITKVSKVVIININDTTYPYVYIYTYTYMLYIIILYQRSNYLYLIYYFYWFYVKYSRIAVSNIYHELSTLRVFDPVERSSLFFRFCIFADDRDAR